MYFRGLLLTSALLAACVSGASEVPASPFEISRYQGRWYVVAQSAGLTEPRPARVEYRAQGLDVEERSYAHAATIESEAELLASRRWTADRDSTARWTESAWWPFGARLTVLYVSPDYRQSLVDGPDGPQVLAREPQLPEWVYAGLLVRLTGLGYDVAKLRRVPQALVE